MHVREVEQQPSSSRHFGAPIRRLVPLQKGGSFIGYLLNDLAVQDGVVGGYLLMLLSAVLMCAKGPGRPMAIATVLLDLVGFSVGLLLTRGGLVRRGSFVSSVLYRLTVFLPVFLSYFQLRWILPAVSPHSLDAALLALDVRVFGVEPSLAWDRFVTPATTEWFAFFYFGYFFLLSAHLLPMMFAAKSRLRLAHFTLGIILVFCTGQLLYMVVPGWGPYRHLAGQFAHPLEGGLFWRLVRATVDAGGSQKDIFPSLHTAAPTYFATYSFIHRRALPYRLTWPLIAFAATQIVLATMFLRWHYLIDICAGLALGISAAHASFQIVTWERSRRRKAGVRPTFALLDWSWIWRFRGESGSNSGDRMGHAKRRRPE